MKPTNEKDRFELDRIKAIDLATLMDYINDYVIKYYTLNDLDKPTFLTLAVKIENKFKRYNNVHVELALNIMQSEDYIHLLNSEDNNANQYTLTDKGLLKFFNGGFKKEIKKKRNERILVSFAQIAVILAGIYYLIEIIKHVYQVLCSN